VQPFYEPLRPYGSWAYDNDLGWGFRPTVSVGWSPYSVGRWVWNDTGWLWQSDEPFGWACFHYGRWSIVDGGWFWIPGSVWAPSWVTWNRANGYIGWAPLMVGRYAPVYRYVEPGHFTERNVGRAFAPRVIHHESRGDVVRGPTSGPVARVRGFTPSPVAPVAHGFAGGARASGSAPRAVVRGGGRPVAHSGSSSSHPSGHSGAHATVRHR
jgi:hypothetical protein